MGEAILEVAILEAAISSWACMYSKRSVMVCGDGKSGVLVNFFNDFN